MSAAENTLLIVGGGLAGLACALRLHEAGARLLLFKRSDSVGGRVRSDRLWSASIEGAMLSGLRTADAIVKPS